MGKVLGIVTTHCGLLGPVTGTAAMVIIKIIRIEIALELSLSL
jgi:hypothetical protein